ncbi:MAG TPA: hypothetical protein GX707_07215 [Epulopiscium sp.]|nr:hypothetical protein [Candidatus Epulonipiscium sp.]
MKMVVAVENGLGDISIQLRQRGYTIVSYPEYAGVVDAFIYKEEIAIHAGSYENNEIGQPLENYESPRPRGVLIINATNKSLGQIEEILKTRIYSPFF